MMRSGIFAIVLGIILAGIHALLIWLMPGIPPGIADVTQTIIIIELIGGGLAILSAAIGNIFFRKNSMDRQGGE